MDYYKRIKEIETEFSSLRTRQDDDKDLLYLKKYALKDADNKPVPNIIPITLNRPAVFAANVIAALGKVSEQVIISSERKSLDKTYIEQFIRAGFASANDLLRKRGRVPLNPFLDEQFTIRGGGAARCVFQMVDGKLVTDVEEWDSRFVTAEYGTAGLNFAGYSSKMKESDIKAQSWYQGSEALIDRRMRGATTIYDILEVWDTTHNEIWIGNDKVFEQGHDLGYTPVILEFVPLGSNLADTDAIGHHGESIFFLIRTIIPELNRLATIVQTLNFKAIKGPIKAKKRGGGEAPDYEEVTGLSAVTVIEPDEDIQPVDYGDAKRAAEMVNNMFNQALAEGSLPPEAFGSINLDLSGVALLELGERSGQVQMPRLETKALFNQRIAEMFLSQCLKIGGTIELGAVGHERSFDTEKLKGEYTIGFKYFPKSPRLDMARYAMAAQAKTVGLTQKAIDEEILQREDPEGDERQRRWEEAERLSPSIKLFRILRSLQEDAERGDKYAEFEADLLEVEMGVSLQQMLMGQTGQTPQIEEAPKPNPLMLGPGGQVSSAKKASDTALSPLTPVKE